MKADRFILTILLLMLFGMSVWSQASFRWKGEKLNRGVVAVPRYRSCQGYYVSWRMLNTDDEHTTFDVLRDDKVIAKDLNTVTSFFDTAGNKDSRYRIVTKQYGEVTDTSAIAVPWDDVFLQVHLDRPPSGDRFGYAFEYYPNDCSAGDLDGDGDYEIVVKWQPNMAADNAQFGWTAKTYIDAYKLDGTRLWRIDLGYNIRSGAHYTQYLVYDFDNDGRAELVCKTAPGTIDGQDKYVSEAATENNIRNTDNSKDYTYETGFIVNGPEYLTIFDGEDGHAIHTVYYNPNRGFTVGGEAELSPLWGDEYGNRADRFLACVAYLDGPEERPSAVMCRGYYTRSYLWAVDFDGERLSTRWRHGSVSTTMYTITDGNGKVVTKTNKKATYPDTSLYTAYANGNHNISVADVDGDGMDEIIYGSATIDHDGYLLYSTGLAHGDAMHVGDLMPDRPGLEVFVVHENYPFGWDVHDAATGEILLHHKLDGDTGRGMAANVTDKSRGYEFWSFGDGFMYDVNNQVVGNSMSFTFRIFWDGDLQDELLGDIGRHNQPFLEKYGVGRLMVGGVNVYQTGYSMTCNGTKGTPCLTADLFGDWREEMIFYNGNDNSTLNIYSTSESTKFRVPTLMHDHLYRLGVAWQNIAYNQPPHLGYYLPDSCVTRICLMDEDLREQTISLGEEMKPVRLTYGNCKQLQLQKTIMPDGKTRPILPPVGIKQECSAAKVVYTLSGKPEEEGCYQFIVKAVEPSDGAVVYDTIRINVLSSTPVTPPCASKQTGGVSYDLSGRRLAAETNRPGGICVRDNRKYIRK